MTLSASISPFNKGRREQKRRETSQRIADIGLKLFVTKGYDKTTLDEIAAEVGISRRSFFNYFQSKEQILLAWQGSGFGKALISAIVEQSPNEKPITILKKCMVKLAERFETKEAIAVDRMLQASDTLKARKLANLFELEDRLFAALCVLWPAKSRHFELRVVSINAIGILRLSLDKWREDGKYRLTNLLEANFKALEKSLK